MNNETAFILPMLKQIELKVSFLEQSKQINRRWCPNCLISVQLSPGCPKQSAFQGKGKKRQPVILQAGTSSFSSSNWRLQKMHYVTAEILSSSKWVQFKTGITQSQGQGIPYWESDREWSLSWLWGQQTCRKCWVLRQVGICAAFLIPLPAHQSLHSTPGLLNK